MLHDVPTVLKASLDAPINLESLRRLQSRGLDPAAVTALARFLFLLILGPFLVIASPEMTIDLLHGSRY